MAGGADIVSDAGDTGVGAGGAAPVGGEEEAVSADGAVLLVGLAALDAVGDGGDQRARVADSSLEVEVEPLGTVGAG